MVAMAAIVAQNGATGQSLVEQFTTGNLNPFVGGYAQKDAGDRLALRAEFGSGAGKSTAIPWDPIPQGLSNDIFNSTYVGDVGFDPAGSMHWNGFVDSLDCDPDARLRQEPAPASLVP